MNSPASSLPEFIVENPRLGDWFAFASPRSLTLKTGKVEIGQDILTALRQIAAEELELPLAPGGGALWRYQPSPERRADGCEPVDHDVRPRRACGGEPKCAGGFFRRPRLVLRVPASQLSARLMECFTLPERPLKRTTGRYWRRRSRRTNYWRVSRVRIQSYRLVGTSPVSSDLVKKLSGAAFIHDFSPSGMLHGRALRQPHWKPSLSGSIRTARERWTVSFQSFTMGISLAS